MKNVIINADDFGLTDGCNKGIVKGIKDGVVTSTTVMMNMPYANKGIEMLKSMSFKSAGVHLTLTCGEPTLPAEEIPSLVDNENRFYRRRAELFPKLRLEEVEKELRNQIELFIKTGSKPSHLDSHHHIHMYDGIREVVAKLAKEYNLPLRYANEETKQYLKENNIPTTDNFSMDFYGKNTSINRMKEILENASNGTIEIMVHPAIVDKELESLSSYSANRSKELEILISRELKNWFIEKDIKLIGFNNI